MTRTGEILMTLLIDAINYECNDVCSINNTMSHYKSYPGDSEIRFEKR